MNEIAKLTGRLVMVETVLAAAITHLAELAADPAAAIGAIMGNAEDNLERAAKQAAADERQAAQAARDAFDDLSDAMQRHIAQRAQPRN